jgi:phenylacetate-CoA ligase
MEWLMADLLLDALVVAASAHGYRARDWYEDAFHRVIHPAYESPLRGRGTLRHLRQYRSHMRLSPDALADLQWRTLQLQLRHCWANVPFYREHWSAEITDIDEVRSMDDFRRLPLLTKQHVRERFADLHATGQREAILYKSTDGTTGEPLRFGYSREVYERRQAVMLRGYGWAGYRVGARALYLWWSPQLRENSLQALRERLQHRLFNRHYVDAMHLEPANLADYARRIADLRPKAIVSYVMPLYHIARWALEGGHRLHRPDVILTAAEPLEPFQREAIEQAFRCPVRNTYGCREFMLMAAEHQACGRMHVNADHLVLESIPLDIEGARGSEQLVVTDLWNRAMPLVRYVNGDVGALAAEPCTCGLPFPVLDRVDGRRLDAVVTPTGRRIHFSAVTYVFLSVPGVRQYKVIEHGQRRLEVRVVPGDGWSDEVGRRIVAEIERTIGEPMPVELNLVDWIPPGRTGKFRITEREPA